MKIDLGNGVSFSLELAEIPLAVFGTLLAEFLEWAEKMNILPAKMREFREKSKELNTLAAQLEGQRLKNEVEAKALDGRLKNMEQMRRTLQEWEKKLNQKEQTLIRKKQEVLPLLPNLAEANNNIGKLFLNNLKEGDLFEVDLLLLLFSGFSAGIYVTFEDITKLIKEQIKFIFPRRRSLRQALSNFLGEQKIVFIDKRKIQKSRSEEEDDKDRRRGPKMEYILTSEGREEVKKILQNLESKKK